MKRGLKYGQALSYGALAKFTPGENAKKALRRAFAKKLVELRGVPMKLSQILSMGNSAEQTLAHKEAIVDIEPMPFAFVEEYLQKNASGLMEKVSVIEPQGLAASLGQVHKAETKNKDTLAIKIKYPDIFSHMDMDNALFGLVTKTFNNFKEGFTLQDYQKIIRAELEGELDYPQEVKKQQELFAIFSNSDTIVIPQAFQEMSGEDHIAMTWEDGLPIDSFLKQANDRQKKDIVNSFLDFYFTAIFEHGIIHADPNRGNFAFRVQGEEAKLVVYDFGSVVYFDRERALALLKIMQLTKRGEGDLLPWLVQVGFDAELLKPLQKSLLAFCELLFEPFLSERRYDLNTWNRKKRAEDILGEHRWNFMIAANADLLPFMRAMQGLFYYLNELDVGMYARPKVEQLWSKCREELRSLQPPQVEGESIDLAMAKYLKIQVFENGQQKVALSFPRMSIENLEDIVPDDVEEKLHEQNIKIDDIVQKSRQNGYEPMDLFKVSKGTKNIRVALE